MMYLTLIIRSIVAGQIFRNYLLHHHYALLLMQHLHGLHLQNDPIHYYFTTVIASVLQEDLTS